MKLKEIAERIHKHLKNFENDSVINKPYNSGGFRPYFMVNTHAGGKYVYVTYISYQGSSALNKNEAMLYLEKLDNGFIGRHFEAFREK